MKKSPTQSIKLTIEKVRELPSSTLETVRGGCMNGSGGCRYGTGTPSAAAF